MTVITGAVAVLALVGAALLIAVILLQQPQGGGLAGVLGHAGEPVFDTSSGAIRRLTSVVAAVWITACAAHAFLI